VAEVADWVVERLGWWQWWQRWQALVIAFLGGNWRQETGAVASETDVYFVTICLQSVLSVAEGEIAEELWGRIAKMRKGEREIEQCRGGIIAEARKCGRAENVEWDCWDL
jgi:hypothetical protein